MDQLAPIDVFVSPLVTLVEDCLIYDLQQQSLDPQLPISQALPQWLEDPFVTVDGQILLAQF